MRLAKSGIECVILAGSSFFALSRAEFYYWAGLVSSWRAQRAFVQGFWHFGTQNLKISLARQGVAYGLWFMGWPGLQVLE